MRKVTSKRTCVNPRGFETFVFVALIAQHIYNRLETMNVLLTFTGFHDPYSKGLVDQEEQPGPILSLLSARPFDQVYLFDTPGTTRLTQET